MNKKAFTLVELLAVIIILGILSILIIPKVLTSIEEADKNANMTSAKNLAKAAEYKATNNQIGKNDKMIIVDYSKKENINEIEYIGSKPTAGQIKITNNGRVEMAVKIGDFCYKKNYDSDDIEELEYDEATCNIEY